DVGLEPDPVGGGDHGLDLGRCAGGRDQFAGGEQLGFRGGGAEGRFGGGQATEGAAGGGGRRGGGGVPRGPPAQATRDPLSNADCSCANRYLLRRPTGLAVGLALKGLAPPQRRGLAPKTWFPRSRMPGGLQDSAFRSY